MTVAIIAGLGDKEIGLDIVAIVALVGAIVKAYGSGALIGPQRGKVLEETTSGATKRAADALVTALDHVEEDNARLRGDVDRLDAKLEDVFRRLRAVERERDELARRVDRMLRRFAELGETPPA